MHTITFFRFTENTAWGGGGVLGVGTQLRIDL